MTLLISWIGVDDKKEGKAVASLYIASDSRYSWGDSSSYDYGIKVFGCSQFPDIFGFCGDVSFPSIVLGQLISQIDSGIMFSAFDDTQLKNEKIFEYMRTSLKSYPKDRLTGGSFTILHGSRYGKKFSCFKTTFDEKAGLKNIEVQLPLISTKICSEGSGKEDFDSNFHSWLDKRSNNFRTSRGVYHCLVKTLNETKDIGTGGLPQIMGLYMNRNARLFGIIEGDKKYIYGKESSGDINSYIIEWRNENFERMDPSTLKLLPGAQRQPS